jgi:hypothetical protein
MIWAYFILIQLVSLAATLIGYVVLLPLCLCQAWTAPNATSTKPLPAEGRFYVDAWAFGPLNRVYGNPEDGVSGKQAYIWGSGPQAGQLIPYMADSAAWWRAYCWNARNSADALKYLFKRQGGPLVTFTLFGRQYRAGWNANGLPTLEAV